MNIVLPYRKGAINLDIDDTRVAGILEPNEVNSTQNPLKAVRDALSTPEGEETFQEFMDAPGDLLVIVNDGSRPTPTRFVLAAIADALEKAQASFMVATGVHRRPTEEEFNFIFGDVYERFSDKICVHDARNDEMVHLGTTVNGTEIFINKKVYEVDKLLVIGSVEPHYFAGYTGGRKGILPGVAAFTTIEQNHKHALSSASHILALEGNPVHEDMMDAVQFVQNRIFSIMTVLDKHQDIYAVTAGGIVEAFYRAVEKANEVFVIPIRNKADVVVSCAKYPMDIDLYQAQKAIENVKPALKEGGTLILVSACWDGIGEKVFSDLLSSCETPEAVFEKISGKYCLGYHKAGKYAELLQWAKIQVFSDLEDHCLKSIFLEPIHDLQSAVERALEAAGSNAQVLFIPDGSVTVPLVT